MLDKKDCICCFRQLFFCFQFFLCQLSCYTDIWDIIYHTDFFLASNRKVNHTIWNLIFSVSEVKLLLKKKLQLDQNLQYTPFVKHFLWEFFWFRIYSLFLGPAYCEQIISLGTCKLGPLFMEWLFSSKQVCIQFICHLTPSSESS